MIVHHRYKGIFYMLLAALGFSLMGGSAKLLKESFNAGQLVFFRNMVGAIGLTAAFIVKPAVSRGGKFLWLVFRGFMGTVALYTLLYCVLHLPLSTAMTYNLTSAVFIALFSFLLFGEYHGLAIVLAVIIGFIGMLMVYKPNMHYPWQYHAIGLLSGIVSAIAYITLGKLAPYYDSRVIVSSFIFCGVLIPALFMIVGQIAHIRHDDFFFIEWKWPVGAQWIYILWLGLAALAGQYFVTKAYGADKASIVSVFGYANIIFSVFIGMALGDSFPGIVSWTGISCIILSGIIVSITKKKVSA
ncbi:MAG TPA: DMT family transporter [Chitinophagaceae bacterium]|jgi:drug/metabolite transporter (DMT)-like permease